LLQQKPQLNDYFLYLKIQAGGDETKWKTLIDDAFNYIFARVDIAKQQVVVAEFEYMDKLIEWLKDNTESKLDGIPDFEEGFSFDSFDVPLDDAIQTFKQDANEKNQKLMKQIMALVKPEEEEEDVDYDLEWLANEKSEVEHALIWSAEDGQRVGAESDAYQSVAKFFNNEEDVDGHGFTIVPAMGGAYKIIISLKDLEEVYKTNDDWNSGYNDLNSYIKYKYDAPYYGFSGFDKEAYNERLSELLHEALSDLSVAK
jgi:hypothetical protein